jgi:hypothetical protein
MSKPTATDPITTAMSIDVSVCIFVPEPEVVDDSALGVMVVETVDIAVEVIVGNLPKFNPTDNRQ